MTRNFLSATTAIALVLSPISVTQNLSFRAGIAAYAQPVDRTLLKALKKAEVTVEKAEKELQKAQEKGEGVKAAAQALDAAKAELAAATAQLGAPKTTAAETPKVESEPKADASASETPTQPAPATADAPNGENRKKRREATETQPVEPKPAEQVTKEPTIEEKPATAETTVQQPVAPPAATADAPNGENRKKRREAAETQPVEPKPAEQVTKEPTIEEKPATAETTAQQPVEPPAPSPDAPKAKDIADAPIEKQIKQAEETPAAVVPDNVTKAQQQDLKAAEQVRRKKAKDNRLELLGAAAVGLAVGALLPALGGRVVEDQGDRIVVERDGHYYVRKDESALFRDDARNIEIENLRGGRTLETVYRRDGSRIESIRDPGGYVLRRVKIDRNGRETVLFDVRDDRQHRAVDYDRTLPPIQLNIPRDQYIVSGRNVGRRSLADIFMAPPVEQVNNGYSLRDIRENNRVRSIVRRVDLDIINFDTGSATVRNSQVPYLADTAGSMLDVIDENPQAVFLLEGHTDAVGSEIYNLTLSDRRAETVARILVDAYGVPPENLVTQGYGEEYLKINTDGPERENRRVTIRNITPLLKTSSIR